jgi:arsenate reductase
MFGPVSGGHFNPVVSLADATFGGIRWRTALAYIPAQTAGCISGALLANAMFVLPAVSISTHHRASPAHLLAEIVATAGLLLVIFALARTRRASATPAAVGAYIGAAYWFTSSTSFANPAITVGRIFSNTFAGIAPASAPAFVLAQLAGGFGAVVLVRTLYPDVTPADAAQVILPHSGARALAAPSTPEERS